MTTSATQFDKEAIWRPDENSGEKMKTFISTVEKKHNLKSSDYWDFHKWTVENIAEFWAEIWNFMDIIYSKPYDEVVDISIPMEESRIWFEGAKLNFAENLLKHRSDHIALILTGENTEVDRLSYKQLFEETRVYASALRKIGLQNGDVVTCYMSNRKEAVLAMLAATSIGAVFTGGLPTLTAEEYYRRMKQVQPKILFTIDEFTYMKKTYNLLNNIKELAEKLLTLEKVIIVPSRKNSKLNNIRDIKKSCFLDEFLETAKESDGTVRDMIFEQVSFSHPVFISFTSGTTGLPKILVHGFGGLLSMFRNHILHGDIRPDDTLLSVSAVGWVAWNIVTIMLFNGSTTVLFDGLPFFITPTYFWDMIDSLNITTLYLTPTIIDEMDVRNYLPNETHHLNSLDKILLSGSVVKPRNYDFCRKLKDGIRPINVYGCTELMVLCLVSDATLPLYVGECSCPALGTSFECLDEKGNPVSGEMGELVITKPVPSLALGFWGDTNGELFKKSYFSKYPGKFLIGDMIIINSITKGIIVCGRSDETIKQHGCRFGSSEIYNVVNTFHEIRDSLCIGKYTKDGDERAILFILMNEGHLLKEELVKKLREHISKELSPKHVPEVIIEAPGIPYNRNMKKTESIVKKIINKMPHNSESVSNPEYLKFYYDVGKMEDFTELPETEI